MTLIGEDENSKIINHGMVQMKNMQAGDIEKNARPLVSYLTGLVVVINPRYD